MTVQELIDELNKIENKENTLVYSLDSEYGTEPLDYEIRKEFIIKRFYRENRWGKKEYIDYRFDSEEKAEEFKQQNDLIIPIIIF